MIAGADTYLKLANDKTKIVPGHGPLADKADVSDLSRDAGDRARPHGEAGQGRARARPTWWRPSRSPTSTSRWAADAIRPARTSSGSSITRSPTSRPAPPPPDSRSRRTERRSELSARLASGRRGSHACRCSRCVIPWPMAAPSCRRARLLSGNSSTTCDEAQRQQDSEAERIIVEIKRGGGGAGGGHERQPRSRNFGPADHVGFDEPVEVVVGVDEGEQAGQPRIERRSAMPSSRPSAGPTLPKYSCPALAKAGICVAAVGGTTRISRSPQDRRRPATPAPCCPSGRRPSHEHQREQRDVDQGRQQDAEHGQRRSVAPSSRHAERDDGQHGALRGGGGGQ